MTKIKGKEKGKYKKKKKHHKFFSIENVIFIPEIKQKK